MRDRFGRPYGWGVARYGTPEALWGYDEVAAAYTREPEESLERLLSYLAGIFPDVSRDRIRKLIE